MEKSLKNQEVQKLLDNPKVIAWRTLMGAYNQIYRYLESELLKENCSVPRFQIFFYLYFNGPLSSTELAELLHVTRGNISTFIKRLKDDSLITISKNSGRGGKRLIGLSNKGIEQFERFFPQHIQRICRIMPDISPKSLKSLKDVGIP